jgi:pectate lyase
MATSLASIGSQICSGAFFGVAILGCLTVVSAQAETRFVGPNQTYKTPSDAAGAASPGDTIRIEPGTYYDCAVWKANNLTIEGAGPGVVLTDRICEGKAIFVIPGNDVTLRNLTFQRARAEDGNGAGIRAEGVNLTVDGSRFLDNQEGILAGDNSQSTIVIRNSTFERNGACTNACAHGIYVDHIALLHIEHSRFFDNLIAHHVKSRAARTEIVDTHIEDGPGGTASYLVDIPNGGSLVISGNVLEKGPQNQNHGAAIIIGEEGVSQPTPELTIRHNMFTNDGPPTAFVKNITATPAQLTGNILKGRGITPLIGDGTVH